MTVREAPAAGRTGRAVPYEPAAMRSRALRYGARHLPAGERSALTTYRAQLWDDRFAISYGVALGGPPSRARVSPDGRLAAFTAFISGRAYSAPSFTTRTSTLDTRTGEYVVQDQHCRSHATARSPRRPIQLLGRQLHARRPALLGGARDWRQNVDDQVEWLDDRQMLYGMPKHGSAALAETGVWALAIEGASSPRFFLRSGFSPAVVR